MIFFCSAEVDMENLDLFAKLCFGNMLQDKLCSKPRFKSELSWEEFIWFS